MTRTLRLATLLIFLGGSLSAADVVVLKGGAVITLKSPPVRRGNTVLLTKTDGTVLSVPISEIDRAATAASRSVAASPAPAATPVPAATLAAAARAAREIPKARVRITDADVSHSEARQAQNEAAAGEAAAAADASAGAGRVEVADYTQEKSGDALVVRGTLKNPGATPAINVRMSVTAIDVKGQTITSAEAGMANNVIDPSKTVAFSATLPVGARAVGSIRFSPRWVSPALPAASPAPGADSAARNRATAAAAESAAAPAATAVPKASAPPPPAPTPFGRGNLYAAPPPNAPSQPPPDGKTGYLPGASNPANQPKPPN
jgi:hypothetical protein